MLYWKEQIRKLHSLLEPKMYILKYFGKEVRYIIIIYVLTVCLSILSLPFGKLLSNCNVFITIEAELLAKLIVRLVILIFVLFIIKNLNLKAFNARLAINNFQALVIPLAIIVLGIINNWNLYINTEIRLIILFIFSVLATGIFEESLFRGIILPLFIKAFGKHKHAIYLGVLSSALLFGITHYLNLIKEPDNFWGVTNQVFFATAMGIFFAGLLFRTRNIIVVAIFHALVNFSFGAGILASESKIPNEVATIINGPTIIFLIFIASGGVYMIKQTKKEDIMNLLQEVNL